MTSYSLNDYKLSCELFGHSMDVRSVTQGKDSNTIISGSRDRTTKIWHNDGNQFQEIATLKNHTNYISVVYYLKSQNWICTGSNDSTICVYRENSQEPFVILRGHQSNVCALAAGLQPNQLISGSWDQTGKIWSIDDSGTSTFITLTGHEAAVWACASLPTGKYVTGSADKLIFYWNAKGEKLRVLKGHTDCVRALIGLSDGGLISCSNDATIKYWNEEGECVKELHGHSNYIYTISMNPTLGSNILVSGGEDSSIRMWCLESGQLGDALIVPAQSVWSVCCLANGDIVTGTSDGLIRIFTRDSNRVAPSNVTAAYNLAVETMKMEKNKELGGYKKSDLPGPESLLQPGKEGQTKIVRHPDGSVICYQFEKGAWIKLGDVTGASGGTQATSGKTLFEGKEYDYVFSVDISDTDPPIKLPYNRGEDPWQAAQAFIHKNNLPQVYLDQVANFIVKNSDGASVIEETSSGYQDPFTGENRYVPGTNSNAHGVQGPMLDPFTGSSSYTTGALNESVKVNFSRGQKKHFPISAYVTFDNCDSLKVFEKLREFNNKIDNADFNVNDDVLKSLINLTEKDPKFDTKSIESLLLLLKWPKEYLFPVLDVARLAIRHEQIYSLLNPIMFLDMILINLNTSGANQLMAIRCVSNLMCHPLGRQNIEQRLEAAVESLKNIKEGSANLQIALATFYLNLTISQTAHAKQSECLVIAEGIIELLKWSMDLEACYRAIQAIGNLSCTPFGQLANAQVISVDYVMDKIRELADTPQRGGFEKINECANALLASF